MWLKGMLTSSLASLIPTKKRKLDIAPSCDEGPILSESDHKCVDSIDEALRVVATGHIVRRNVLVKGHVDHIEKMRVAYVARYTETLNATYLIIKTALLEVLARKETQLYVRIAGNQVTFGQPTMKTWVENNPGPADALAFVMQELEHKGWSPHTMLSPASYDSDDGMWTGGNQVILTCDLCQEEEVSQFNV